MKFPWRIFAIIMIPVAATIWYVQHQRWQPLIDAADAQIEQLKKETAAPGAVQIKPIPTRYTFMEVAVVEHGKPANEKFFIGRLPVEGEAVEMVYTGSEDGRMKFQLRVREK